MTDLVGWWHGQWNFQWYCNKTWVDEFPVLQDDLDRLQDWEQDWLMEFNPAKCEAITITKKTRPVKTEYKLHDQILAAVESAKYLGVNTVFPVSFRSWLAI